MRTQFKVLLATSALMGGLLAAPILYAQSTDSRGNQPSGMMSEGGMGQGGMMGHGMMEQMTRMMENCNKMMESAMADDGQKEAPAPSEQPTPAR